MSKKPHFPPGLQVTAVWLSAVATMAGATLFSAQPARAEEELIILTRHDSGAIRDAVAAAGDGRVKIVLTTDEDDSMQFYAGPAYPEPLDSNCAGVDLSQAYWYGRMANIIAGNKCFRRVVYRMGAEFPAHGMIRNVLTETVQHGYFRHLDAGETEEGSTQHLVRATGEGNPPSDTEFTLCVVWVDLSK